MNRHPKSPPAKSPKQCNRNFQIDLLKAFSALAVILIHVTSKYTETGYVAQVWQWAHFAVGVFVFASGYLVAKYNETLTTLPEMWKWFKKRIVRLVQPYYLYVVVHIALILVLPAIFNRSIHWNPGFFVDTILLDGGFGQNWIPRIFVFLTLLYLVIQIIRSVTKSSDRIYLWAFMITLFIAFIFQFPAWDMEWERVKHYQAITWLSLMLLGILFYNSSRKKAFLSIGMIVSLSVTAFGFFTLPALGFSSEMYKNKYPPTLYFIAYNSGVALLLYAIAGKIEAFIKSNHFFDKAVTFLSRESYTIFFVHFIVLDALETPTGFWLTDFMIIAATTIFSVILWNRCITRFGILVART